MTSPDSTRIAEPAHLSSPGIGVAGLPAKLPLWHRLIVKLATNYASLAPLRQEWDEAVDRLGGTIYMSYDWGKIWWDFYGGAKELRLFLFQVDGQVVGVVPLYIDRLGLGPASLKVARLVCANIPPKAFNPAIDQEWAECIFDAILVQLFERDQCDVFTLGPGSDEYPTLGLLESAARRRSDLVGQVSSLSEGVSSVFYLPKTLDEYFEAMDKDERKKRKYELRLLKREKSVTEDVLVNTEPVVAEFDRFVHLHALQWQGKGKLGHFGSWPRAEAFNRALVSALGPLGRVRFVRILAENRVVSSQYAFSFGNCYYWELPARVVDQEWQRFSLGPAGFFALVDAAIKEGKTRVEGGLARYDYKRKLNAKEYPTRLLRLVGKRAGTRLRTRLFLLARWFVLWAYYKLWYARVSPRLPVFLRWPIWSLWLRLDF